LVPFALAARNIVARRFFTQHHLLGVLVAFAAEALVKSLLEYIAEIAKKIDTATQ
jgi:hypothetical protein